MSVMIEIARIEPVPPGKKLAKVMTTGGESYHCWPDKISTLKVGACYSIEYSESEFNGRPWRKLTKVQPVNGNGHAPAAEPAPVPAEAGKAGKAGGEREFIRDLLVVGIRTGAVAFSSHDLRTAVTMLRTLWRELA